MISLNYLNCQIFRVIFLLHALTPSCNSNLLICLWNKCICLSQRVQSSHKWLEWLSLNELVNIVILLRMIIKFVRATVASCEDWTHDPWFTRPELCHWAKDAPLSICWISIGFPRLKASLMSQKYYPSESKAARHCLRMCLFNPHLHFLWVQQQLRNKLANESCLNFCFSKADTCSKQVYMYGMNIFLYDINYF